MGLSPANQQKASTAHLVVGEEGVAFNVVQAALTGMGQTCGGGWHMLCCVQAQQLVQP